MSAPPYVELHAHSSYSFLDGASLPEELAAGAVELGYDALALTDHDGLYGSLEFAHAAKAFGVRPITGAEVTVISSRSWASGGGEAGLRPAGATDGGYGPPVDSTRRQRGQGREGGAHVTLLV